MRPRPATLGCNVAILAAASWAGSALLAAPAHARANGIAATSCAGCHGSSETSGTLTLRATPTTLETGERIELTLSMSGSYADGGTYVSTAGVGDLQIIAGEGLREVSSGLVHERPKPASATGVQFRFGWVAPAQAGAVRFSIYAVGGDGNNKSSGDTATADVFDFVYGCPGQTYYFDGDGDGDGRVDTPQLACDGAPADGFVPSSADCDDYNKDVHPGAAEQCNLLDDDCNGQIDENVAPVELWPDADGDGFYDARTEKVGTPMQGCAGLKGWAAQAGDCQPMNKAINPRAQEVCNNLDDDCDGDIDERVRPTCGEGWCRRESTSCDIAFCRAGAPEPETCNFLDDDCDGEIDEEAELCPSGQSCDGGTCVATVATGGGAGASMSGQAGSTAIGSPAARTDSAGCAFGTANAPRAFALLGLSLWGATFARRRRLRQR